MRFGLAVVRGSFAGCGGCTDKQRCGTIECGSKTTPQRLAWSQGSDVRAQVMPKLHLGVILIVQRIALAHM